MSKKIKRVAIWAEELHFPDKSVEAILKVQFHETGHWVYYKEYTKLEKKYEELKKKLKIK